jgi:hypothetical protein
MTGSLSTAFVETYEDGNDNGTQDGDESVVAWYYWLVERDRRTGVTVRSTRPPAEVYTIHGRAVVLGDPGFLTEDYPAFTDETEDAGLQVEPDVLLDATADITAATVPLELNAAAPPPGTKVEFSGSRTSTYRLVCSQDVDRDRTCDAEEQDQYELLVFDPVTRRAMRVLTVTSPEFSEATLTGLLRRTENGVADAQDAEGLAFADLDLVVSDRYLLDDAAPPGSAPLAFALAVALVAVSGTILVGVAGGYLIYRRAPRELPAPATTLAAGERIPLRLTGLLRRPGGLEHVREVPGDLIRFVLSSPVGTPEEMESTGSTTLLVERVGYPQGVALGIGELDRVSSGHVMTLARPRPAIRAMAGTGPLLLSFDTEAQRDRAVAELLDESGLGRDGKQIRTS